MKNLRNDSVTDISRNMKQYETFIKEISLHKQTNIVEKKAKIEDPKALEKSLRLKFIANRRRKEIISSY